jgi:hypothetical protein
MNVFWSKFGWPALLAIPCALVSQVFSGILITIVGIAIAFHDVSLEPDGTPAVVLAISPWVYVAEFLVLWLIWFWILGALRRRFSKKR